MTGLAKRVIACLDVRANDKGDLVVTKGDQYDVRETSGGRDVRNLGAPVQLAGRYFAEGADEVTFLNITGFRDFPLGDMPMLEVSAEAKSVGHMALGYVRSSSAFHLHHGPTSRHASWSLDHQGRCILGPGARRSCGLKPWRMRQTQSHT